MLRRLQVRTITCVVDLKNNLKIDSTIAKGGLDVLEMDREMVG